MNFSTEPGPKCTEFDSTKYNCAGLAFHLPNFLPRTATTAVFNTVLISHPGWEINTELARLKSRQ